MSLEDAIQFQLHPDLTVEYLGTRFQGVKLVNGIWYFRDAHHYSRFPLQHEVRLVEEDGKRRN